MYRRIPTHCHRSETKNEYKNIDEIAKKHGRVYIDRYLVTRVVEQLYEELLHQVPWFSSNGMTQLLPSKLISAEGRNKVHSFSRFKDCSSDSFELERSLIKSWESSKRKDCLFSTSLSSIFFYNSLFLDKLKISLMLPHQITAPLDRRGFFYIPQA